MGGQGLFTSILVALVTVEIAHFCEKHHIEIKMPESVPPFLSASFSAVIPLIFDTIIFYGGTLILKQFDLTIPTAINKLVSIPLSVVNTAPGVLFIICFGALLWCCGIHGTAIIYPFILPVLAFLGLTEGEESEGFDRKDLKLPEYQNSLMQGICEVQEHVVVVLHNGAPIEMPWVNRVQAILETYLGGQAIGGVVADILYGKVNPSGKLAETFPIRLEDTPAYINFGGDSDHVRYAEGIFVGYRYYDARKMNVLFPFGHGLSYTEYRYEHLQVDSSNWTNKEVVEVSLDVTNVGSRTGKEIIQIYIAPDREMRCPRPLKELKGFEKVELKPGETKRVKFYLEKRAFSHWDVDDHAWRMESGKYRILAGASSRDIRCEIDVELKDSEEKKIVYTLDTPLGVIMEDEQARETAKELLENAAKILMPSGEKAKSARARKMGEEVMKNLPIRNLMAFAGADKAELKALVKELNCE